MLGKGDVFLERLCDGEGRAGSDKKNEFALTSSVFVLFLFAAATASAPKHRERHRFLHARPVQRRVGLLRLDSEGGWSGDVNKVNYPGLFIR